MCKKEEGFSWYYFCRKRAKRAIAVESEWGYEYAGKSYSVGRAFEDTT